jgi:S-adenosylmethionine:tRNA-ribosyltransferase-isomerase (queuine synthetase)
LTRSRLGYVVVVRDPYLAKYIQSVEAIRRKEARYVMDKQFQKRPASVTDTFNDLDRESLEFRREKSKLLNQMIDVKVEIPLEEYIGRNNTRRSCIRTSSLGIMLQSYRRSTRIRTRSDKILQNSSSFGI